MGERNASRYMLTGEVFNAAEAYRIGLLHEIAPLEKLDEKVDLVLSHLILSGPKSITECKSLIRSVANQKINKKIIEDTAKRIALVRASGEGKEGIRSFLDKKKPNWIKDC